MRIQYHDPRRLDTIERNTTKLSNSTTTTTIPQTAAAAVKAKVKAPAKQTETTTTPNPKPTTPTNPTKSHHPTCLIILIDPPMLEDEQEDPETIVGKINHKLEQHQATKDLRIVAAKYNKKGNLVLHTREDRTAEDLLANMSKFIREIGKGRKLTALVDRPWYKIQVDGLSTGVMTYDGKRNFHDSERIHQELTTCNPGYKEALKNIIAAPRWLRTFDELRGCSSLSALLAVDDEGVAKALLAKGTLAAFGRHCSL